MPAALATLGASAFGALSSRRAADKAEKAAEKAAAAIEDAALQARRDVFELFPLAQQDLLAGAGSGFDITQRGLGEQQRLLSAGNLAAQGTVGQGFDAVRAALLGLPVNTAAFQPRGVTPTDPAMFSNPFGGGGGGGNNPFTLGGGAIGAVPTVVTGQGTFQGQLGGGGANMGLNPFAMALDELGLLQRTGTGGTQIDFSGSQVPGSAARMLPPGASRLAQLAFQNQAATDARRLNREINAGGVGGVPTDTRTRGGSNLLNTQSAILNAFRR